MGLEVSKEEDDSTCLVVANGEIDLGTSPRLRQAILAAVDDYDVIRVNLHDIGYMDSSGVATLVEGLKASRSAGKTFELCQPSSSVLKVLQLARLDALFTIVEGTG